MNSSLVTGLRFAAAMLGGASGLANLAGGLSSIGIEAPLTSIIVDVVVGGLQLLASAQLIVGSRPARHGEFVGLFAAAGAFDLFRVALAPLWSLWLAPAAFVAGLGMLLARRAAEKPAGER